MIQLLISISDDGESEVIRCDGLVDAINIPLDQKKLNPKLGVVVATPSLVAVVATPSLVAVVKAVAEVCQEAYDRQQIMQRMTRLERMVGDLADNQKKHVDG